MRISCLVAVLFLAGVAEGQSDQAPVFSGPQVGERLPGFEARHVFGPDAGKTFDPIGLADGKPLAIVFIHEFNRPSVGLTRMIMKYAAKRQKDGLTSGIIFLDDDATAAEARLKRARHALPTDVPIGISVDGQEGPGTYGLNRKMTLTVLVGNENRVTANFPLIQPSVQADALKIAKAIVDVLGGGKAPTLAELEPDRYAAMDKSMMNVPRFRELLGPVINKSASPEQVEKAAATVEKHASTHRAFREHLGTVANRIINAGRLDSYGTPAARTYLRKWAKEFGSSKARAQERAGAESATENKKSSDEASSE